MRKTPKRGIFFGTPTKIHPRLGSRLSSGLPQLLGFTSIGGYHFRTAEHFLLEFRFIIFSGWEESPGPGIVPGKHEVLGKPGPVPWGSHVLHGTASLNAAPRSLWCVGFRRKSH